MPFSVPFAVIHTPPPPGVCWRPRCHTVDESHLGELPDTVTRLRNQPLSWGASELLHLLVADLVLLKLRIYITFEAVLLAYEGAV